MVDQTIVKEQIFEALDRFWERSEFYASRSISDNSRRAYETDWKHFVKWCIGHEIKEYFPAAPEIVAAYFTDLADRGSRTATIARRSTSISVIHSAADLPSPCKTSAVARVLKGIRKTCGRPAQKARPISWAECRKMVDQCDSSMSGKRDKALLLIGWTSAMRRSELVALNLSDINFCEEGLLLTVTHSKTDQEGKGQTIGIPSTQDQYCPVKAVKEWIERRQKTEASNEVIPLFVNLGPKGNKNWFSGEKGRLTDRMISIIVKRYAHLSGLPTGLISAHSLRRGFATECGAHAIPERIIARHTRHRSVESLRGYIEDGTIWRENPLFFVYGIRNEHHMTSSVLNRFE